uniref:non-specific serine/threonine protein kinase n=1 Tax=Thermosphaera aggregans TaxID=54254 RepID=A0A7C2BKU8_9CREN
MNIGLAYKSLTERDFAVLRAIEEYSSRYEYVPLELIEKRTRIIEEHLTLILSKLSKLKMVKKESIAGYKSYRLTYLGHDMLALNGLVRKNVLEALGDKIGVGKESEIYIGLAPGGVKVAVKFLRIGRTSFRRTKILRTWVEEPHTSWYKQARIAAEREFKALKELSLQRALVPTPFGYDRHVVVTEYVEGVELYRRPTLENPEEVFWKAIDTLRIAYQDVGIVHSDLSEYNIIVRVDDQTPLIIDWPQYVYRDHPSSMDLLRRDVEYLVKFFNKVYRVDIQIEDALKKILG